jgi:Fuc2NAc and GlcNAc transferase
MLLTAITPFFLAAVFSWIFLLALIPRLQRHLMDQPNPRSSHLQPVPRGGGLAFVLFASVASALAWLLFSGPISKPLPLVIASLLALPLAVVGFLDDRHNLPASWRYGVQLATGLLLTCTSTLLTPSFASLPLLVVIVIAITALINFTNFMDGLDGLVAGCMAVAMVAASIKLVAPWPIWALVGSLFGFLIWNWAPAKVFMGDVGSTFLGAIYAALVLQARTWSEALAILLVATPLLADACLCVTRRLIDGQHVFQAHRLHLFQRLHQAGWSHARVSSLYIAATAVLAVGLLWGGLRWVISLAGLELLIGVFLDKQVAIPFTVPSPADSKH